MKAGIIVLFISLLLYWSCGSDNSRNQNNSKEGSVADSVSETFYSNEDASSAEKEVIYNDQFVLRVLENDLRYDRLKEIYHPEKVEEVFFKNEHAPEFNDTLVTFIEGKDTISFYKGLGNTIPQRLHIFSDRLILDRDIRVGVNKGIFKEKFNASLTSDELHVQDTEGGNVFIFFFQHDKMISLSYKSTYLD